MDKPDEVSTQTALGKRYLRGELKQDALPAGIATSRKGEIPDTRAIDENAAERMRRVGIDAVKAGKAVFGILAAGASSRMDTRDLSETARRLLAKSGADTPPASKALVPVVEEQGRIHNFIDLFYSNVLRFSQALNINPRTVLFVSEKNRQEISAHLKSAFQDHPVLLRDIMEVVQPLEPQIIARREEVEHRRDNFPSEQSWRQALEVSAHFAGCNLDIPKPAGHGEFLHQLVSSGIVSRLIDEGVEYLSVRNIDNVSAVLDDTWLSMLGHAIENDLSLLVEVSERTPTQKGGALIRQNGDWRLAEDPSFEDSPHSATDSFYINNAVAILRMDYFEPIYETTLDDLAAAGRAGDPAQLAEIAERGRRRFPTIVEAKPVALSNCVVGAVAPETNMWESTALTGGAVRVGAIGVPSEADEGKAVEKSSPDEQEIRCNRVRFAPIKKWVDYENPSKQTIVQHVARRILRGELVVAQTPQNTAD